jgi:hypothetical protein
MGFNRKVLDAEKIISKAELEDLYLNKKLPDSKIGKMFGISTGRIHRLRNRYNIKTIEYYQRHHKQKLDEKEKSFVVGTMLGDGHIRLRKESGQKAYPQLMLEQSVKHREFAFWLKEEIKDWLYNVNKPLKQRRIIDKRRNKIYHSYPFQTICHPAFSEFYDAFYENKIKKIMNMKVIEKYFNLYSFAIWLMDDGTLSKRGRRIKMCSHNFSYEDNDKLRNFLGERFELKAHIRKEKDYFCLDFSVDSSNIISDMLRELVIPSMQYKLIPSETTNGAG